MTVTYDRFPIRDNTKKRIESPAKGISEDKTLEKGVGTMATFTGFFARVLHYLWDSGTAQDEHWGQNVSIHKEPTRGRVAINISKEHA